jgi:polyisoprenoid-binding protein YceI
MSTQFELDKRRSRVTVKVFASGVLAGLGHNPTLAARKISGTLQFDPDKPQSSSIELILQADSLEVTDDMKKKDREEIEQRTKEEVLEVGKHAEITFKSTDISVQESGNSSYRLQITGELSLHGVTRQKQVDAQASLHNHEFKLLGEFTISQSEFKLKRVSALAGALKVKDEVQCAFEVHGHKP